MEATNAAALPAISAAAVRRAREEAGRTRRPLVEVLQEQLDLRSDQLVRQLAGGFRYRAVDWSELSAAAPAFDCLPYAEAARRECVAVRFAEHRLRLVFSNPYDAELLAWAEARLPGGVEYCVAHRLDILAWLAKQEESMRAMDQGLPDAAPEAPSREAVEDLSLQTISESESPVVRLVNSTLHDALKSRASDIHFEATGVGLAIKYRVDGVLALVKGLNSPELSEQVLSRIKVMAELDIAERRIPQDGRFKAMSKGREIDFRVSVMPSIHGEDAVVRILDKRYLADRVQGLRLDHLGFAGSIIGQLRQLAAEPYGMLLATGPTGSGKTTTLYAVISEINQGMDKIITIEDPVEYQLPGVLQIPVNEKKGLTFARGLRSILRHDPDRIMVGEIRDPDTAEIAVQSALTGHLVYTTVHANNVFDVIGRMLHMKIDPYSFVSALNGVLAQRLVRQNCPHCAAPHQPDPALIAGSRIADADLPAFGFMRGMGCGACRGAGYMGRKAIGELLVLNDDLRELIVSRAPARVFKETAVACGTRFLREAALDMVRAGETTLEEVNRVTFVA
ncbi:MAG: type II/IV secretion system protein [Rhodocyclales bacterium]|nr:type II/IV secretion system protein [Rhodocyclales bacterium]